MIIAIKVENLSKLYRLGQIGTNTLSRDFQRWWITKILKKEDPFIKIGEANIRAQKGISDIVYSLKEIDFEVQKGEAIAIIGKNGAGKSTLLKILSRVTSPTTGSIKINGRVASLLEVGTGFHPELTGKENIYLNGAILGMRRKEIDIKFDEIVDFSGVERYIDTPVKRYSSGMYVRLAFAVAAHLDSEILIVDEVLAVGDAEFQKKCLGKMDDVSKRQGRTILFVSHNMSAVRKLCKTGIVLENGLNKFSGKIDDTIDFYINNTRNNLMSGVYRKQNVEGKDIEVIEADILNEKHGLCSSFDVSESMLIRLKINCKKQVPRLYGYVAISNFQGDLIIESDTFDYLPNILDKLKIGENTLYLKIQSNLLAVGEYRVYLSLASEYADNFLVDTPGNLFKFEIIDNSTNRGNKRRSKTSYLIKWELDNG